MLRRRRPPQADDDAALLAGDADAFGLFYRRHAPILLGWLRRRTGDAELAADLAAETFARALQGRRSYDPARGDARAWLFGIARHVLARSLDRGRVEDEMRRRLGMEPLTLDDDALRAVEESVGAATDLLASLSPEQVEAVTGRILEGQEYEALADRLGCSQSVIRKRVSRGLGTIRDALEAQR